jgi:outer membrane receptor protein involved in Fe transport
LIAFQKKARAKSRFLLPLLLGCASTAALGQAQPGDASATAPVPNDDIVVTATRQSESLSKVPLSVAAFSQKTMDSQGVRSVNDIARLTPGLALTPLGSADVSGNNRTISIRGIASTVGSATTGIYVDDTPIQVRSLGNATSNVYPQVFDLERVEVLRGPQGTLFGAGAEGGAVRFITPQPGLDRFTGYARSEIATTEGGAASYEAGAAIGGPIKQDVLGFRISGWYRRDGGYIDRVSPTTGGTLDKNSNSQDNYVVRAALKFRPVENFTATASILLQKQEYDDSSSYTASFSDPDEGKFKAARLIPTTGNDRFALPSLTLQYDGSFFSVISTTSYFTRSVDRNVDYSAFISSLLLGGPYNYGPDEYSSAEIDDRQNSFNQEVRIQSKTGHRLNWVLGGFYGVNKQSSYQYNYDPYFNTARERLGLAPLTLLNGDSVFETNPRSHDEQLAAFGQVDWELLDGVKLTAGVRVAKVDLKATRFSQGPVAGGTISNSAKQSETPVTPKFGASWQVSPTTMLYASASKGYRIGGVNGPQISLCGDALAQLGLSQSPTAYKSDSVWSYESGLKSRLFGGKLHFEASVFDIEWRNIQRGISLASCGSGFVTNFGSASSTGFDLSFDVQPLESFTLSGSIGYADARLTSNVFGPTSTSGVQTVYGRKGDKIGGPPLTWTISGEYDLPIADDRTLYARADYQHIGPGADIDYSVYGADSLIPKSEAYDQVSLRAGARLAGFDLSVFVNNLLNQDPLLTRMRYTTAYDTYFQDSTLRPRTIGLTGAYRF